MQAGIQHVEFVDPSKESELSASRLQLQLEACEDSHNQRKKEEQVR